MATWSKLFSNFAWKNRPDTSTPLGQTLLNRLNNAINGIDDRVITLNAEKASTDDVNGLVANITLNSKNGVFTVTRFDGSTFTINTALEQVVTNFKYDYATQSLVLTLADGTTQNVDLSALITQYEFTSSATILFTVGTDGKVTANIKPNSITDKMLQTNYLADITTQANTAVSASQSALESQSLAEQSAEDADRHADRAEAAADRAESIVGFTVDTELSTSSTNPIANKAVAEALENVDAKTLNGNAVGYFAKETDLEVERQRINNLATLTEGSTTGDAELADIRVGADGKTYTNAGDAVRGQVSDLKSDLSEFGSSGTLPYKFKWEQGNVGGANPDIVVSTRVRSESNVYFPVTNLISIAVGDSQSGMLFLYDTNQNFIRNTDWFSNDAMYSDFGEAKYVRFMVKNNDESNITPEDVVVTFSEGTQITSMSESIKKLEKDMQNDSYYVFDGAKPLDGSVAGYFDAETLNELDVYSKYETLMAEFPEYVTKELLGWDASENYPIRAYVFTPSYVNIMDENTGAVVDDNFHLRKMLLSSGTHGNGEGGDNTESIVALYEFAKELCKPSSSNKEIEYIRENVQVIIVPLVNPWGVVNKSRYNARNVDINRNFSAGWEASEHSGGNAMSEPETVAIDALLSNNKDAMFYIDIHTRGGNTFAQTHPPIMGIGNKDGLLQYVMQRSISKVKSRFVGFNSDLYRSGLGGCTHAQGQSYGIDSGIIECTFMAENNGVKHTALTNKVNIEMLINTIIESANYFK